MIRHKNLHLIAGVQKGFHILVHPRGYWGHIQNTEYFSPKKNTESSLHIALSMNVDK
eukprot:COSAG01_NODE_143_length_24153_cov_54.226116_6_plen_57_part_00